jgi:tRNA-intron endonuclease
MAKITGNKIWEEDEKLVHELAERGFGEKQGARMLLGDVEALYLLEKKKIALGRGGKGLTFKSLFSRLGRQRKDIAIRYAVYKDLRFKGYFVRISYKDDKYLRVYEKGVRPVDGHSAWVIQPVESKWKAGISDISKAVRLAHSVRKKVVWAAVENDEISYFKLEKIVL